ncbi:ABC transporter substrate-binding protein [Maridesulfovibrio bastinii]|uniref:ABC transporter substrate-binding protein n=1 Tax=Maridesulfovibrio bastinii TaxID=47157 RepID=UPI0003F947FA|nr:ABC transporter substrate-binding protein [Maridesulfovibrio bastinii]
MKTLDKLMASVIESGQQDTPDPADLDLLLYSPCPVKLAVKERLDAVIKAYEEENDPIKIHIPMGCTSVDPFDPLHYESDPDKLPSIIASIGFGDFFRKGFSDKFVKTGLFEAVLPEKVTPLHEKAGIVDPKGHYTVYALTPYIFMVDKQRLGDTPPPEKWADLLDPKYRGQINMCGDGDDMADAVLMLIYKDFGMEGIKKLAANANGLMHSSRMGKSGGAEKGGGIYILPYFFAETSKQPEYMEVIWPKDGTAASPIYFLAKKDARPRIDKILEFFIKGFGEIPSAQWFLPLGGPLPPTHAPENTIKWVGWDFIYDNDITVLRDELNGTFRKLVKETF